jgi:hypothetical protein
MSEALPDNPETDPVRTGVPEVDEVLDSLAALDEAEIADHPAVFESAHTGLRAALDGGNA